MDIPRVLEAAWHDIRHHRLAEGASTLTMQLAGGLFLNRSDRSARRKIEETLLAIQIERHYTKEQIFTMYCNQIYLGAGNYGFEAASEYYFDKPVGQLTLPEAAMLAAIIRGPIYAPINHPERALARRNLVLSLMAHDHKITEAQAEEATKLPLGLHIAPMRNDLAPYFVEEVREYLEHTYGTAAVHEQGLRVYTSLNVAMQKAADQAVRDGLHAYDRRHGWRGNLPNILEQHEGPLDRYQSDDWHDAIQKGDYVTGLVTKVEPTFASIKIGPYHAMLTPADFAWTGHKSPPELLKVGDLVCVSIKEISGITARVQLEQVPAAQAALLAIDNASGEIKAMVGGYDFEESKFNRATQAVRQTGSSFKVYVYSDALEMGMTPVRYGGGRAGDFSQRRAELFSAQLRRKIRRPDHFAARAGGFAQCAGGAAARSRGSAERGGSRAKIWDYESAAAVFASGAGRGGFDADRAHLGVHGVSG